MSLNIERLVAENIKRLNIVEMSPERSLVIVQGKNGNGKQQPVTEPVLTPSGWTPIGKIQKGDFVIGSDGRPTRVIGVFPQSERSTFKVTLSDGCSTRCGPEHLWEIWRWKTSKKKHERISEVLTTEQLIKRGVRGKKNRKFAIKPPKPVIYKDSGMLLPIEPYSLGVILGDGHIERTGYVTVTSHDEEIFEYLNVDGWRSEHELGTAHWSRPLRHLGLSGLLAHEKFIPDIYMTASPVDRLCLLKGLMDTDAYCPASWSEFTSTSPKLAKGVRDLALSLGMVANIRTARKKYRYKGKLKQGRLSYQVLIKSKAPPFNLKRKRDKWSPSKQRPDLFRFIDAIEQVEDNDSVCIQVEAQDGLYVTKDYILTHNTSVLDSIAFALQGKKKADQPNPIRDGQDTGTIFLDLGDYKVERTFRRKGDDDYTTKLTVEKGEGLRVSSPQGVLDAMLSKISFDPLEFLRQKPKEQLVTLQALVPDFDFDEHAMERERLYDERTEANRDLKQKEAELAQFADVEGERPKPVDVETLTASINAIHQANREKQQERRAYQQLENQRDAARSNIERIRTQLQEEKLKLAQCIQDLENTAEPEPDEDPQPLITKLAEAQAINRTVADWDARQQSLAMVETYQTVSDDLTASIAALDEKKRKAIEEAELPVPGLSLAPDYVELDGQPFDQASHAQQLRTSIAIAMSGDPEIKVLCVKDGSLLDEDSLALLEEAIDGTGWQLWLECVGNASPVGFTMVDGELHAPEEG